ncbi:SusE domain-containing protein [Pararhodonellum marinum]|uniref:SusE domain-containing protein n=1 Tax=Pararhodonellum marinum TaxID=2755358 RepID=UPI001E63AF3B|nr:SusF/SusE family outer membrane protein [Pararhodonellum marinum]
MIKNITRKNLWFLMLPLMWACSQFETPPVIQQTPSSIVSPTQGSAIVLDIDNPRNENIFEVSRADFGVGVDQVNIIEVDLPGNNFADAKNVGESSDLQVVVLDSLLNVKLIELGLEADQPASVEFRVRTTTERELSDLVGSPIELTVTPYSIELDLPFIRVPGDYQGWTPGNNNTIIYSEDSDDVYEGFVHILSGSGEFKFLTTPDWNPGPAYGTGASAGTLSDDPTAGNLKVPGQFGTHRVKADLVNLTYEIERIGIWGIIGDATTGGWDNETPMSFNAANNILTITTDLTEGEFKFRTQSWDFNYGLGSADGVAGFNSPDNIPIPEDGNYTITLDMKDPNRVLYTITLN